MSAEEKKELLELLAYCWERVPQWRFCQMIDNVVGHHADYFFVQNEKLLTEFRAFKATLDAGESPNKPGEFAKQAE